MILLNFGHPLTPQQIEQSAALASQPVEQVYDLPVQFDPEAPFEPQLRNLVSALPLGRETLQTAPLLVNLPSLNFITALVLAELHGRMGYFPAVLRLAPVTDSLPARYEVAEILNLQAVRDRARQARY